MKCVQGHVSRVSIALARTGRVDALDTTGDGKLDSRIVRGSGGGGPASPLARERPFTHNPVIATRLGLFLEIRNSKIA